MALVVNSNVPSLSAQRYLSQSRNEMEQAMERLSSGKRINSAADDAAGLAIATRMETQISGLNMAIRNANDGISLVQTTEGAITEVTDMLQRMRELSLQAVHGVNSDDDRSALDAEVQALKAEIDRIASTTTFNGINILDGSYNANLQIGYNASETMGIAIADLSTSALGLGTEAASGSNESSSPSMVSARLDLSGLETTAGDVVIDGVALSAFSDSDGDDISDLVRLINEDVETVQATGFNTFVAKEVGTGIALANKIVVKVGQIGESTSDADYQASKEAYLAASSNMNELVQNINDAFDDGEIVASLNSEGKLVLSNSTGADISIVDTSGTATGYDGATGFKVSASSALPTASTAVSYDSENEVAGFIKLTSNDDSPVSVDIGNKGLASPGSVSDLTAMGLQRVIEDPDGNTNQVLGGLFTTSTDLTTKIEISSNGVADLIINDVEIYDQTLSNLSNTFQGKLDLINAFQDETGVVASAYFEKSFDFSSTDFVATNSFKVNGVSVNYGTSLAVMASNINVSTGTHGLTASVVGDNLILAGENVQNVNIDDVDYEISASTIQAPARRSGDAATATQALTVATADVAEGRSFTLTFGQATSATNTSGADPAGTIFQTANFTVSYTVASGDTAGDVAEGLRDAIHARIAAHSTATGAAAASALADFNQFASVTAATLSFTSHIEVGDRNLTLSADALTNKAFGGDQTLYGGIKLSSVSGDAISIELGEGHAAASHKFAELNVGDTTWDKNSPTDLVSVNPSPTTVSGLSVDTSDAANIALGVIDAALQQVSDTRSNLGAIENRLSHTVSNLSSVVENSSAAQSRIQDADFALEAAALARAQILQQAGTAMLAQANAAPQNVLSLLG